MTENLPVVHSGFSFADMQRLADSIARSRLFGMQNSDQALVLMSISQAEGRHPALAARDYDIIQGRPAKKAEAMQRDFMAAGGKIEWHKLSDTEADATFSHPMGGTIRIDWNMERATKAGLGSKDMWKKYPRQMLKARVVSEGVRTVFPTATSGMYVPEEVDDFREPIDVTPAKETESQVDRWRDERDGKQPATTFEDVGLDIDRLIAQGNAICNDPALLELWWKSHLSKEQRGALGATRGAGVGPYLPGWKKGEKQAPAPVPEPPAGDTAPGDASPPQADVFGLIPLTDDEMFCDNILFEARAFTILTAFDQLKADLADPKHPRGKRVNELPDAIWRSLMAQIGEIETKLAAT